MGLDAVELIMEVEETFDLSIADDEYSRFKTVGDLHQLLVEKLAVQRELQANVGGCPSLVPFLAIRRAIVTLANTNRSSIRPNTCLANVFPQYGRRQLWKKLQRETDITLPPLTLSEGVGQLTFAVAVCGITIVDVATVVWFGLVSFLFAVMDSFILGLLIFVVTRPLATTFPAKCQTVADLVRFARPPHYPSQRLSGLAGDADAIWNKLVDVVVSALGVERADVTPEARFVEDLMVG